MGAASHTAETAGTVAAAATTTTPQHRPRPKSRYSTRTMRVPTRVHTALRWLSASVDEPFPRDTFLHILFANKRFREAYLAVSGPPAPEEPPAVRQERLQQERRKAP